VFGQEDDWAGPPDPQGFWRRLRVRLRRHRGTVALIVVAAVVATVVAVKVWPDDTCGNEGSGVQRIDGQCVGVTDGSFVFHQSFADIQDRIATENRRVSGSGETVTVALLDPLTVTDTSAASVAQVRNELVGAYTAQYRINHTAAVGDRRPLVKLVLANWGSHQLQWQPVVEQLEGMVDDPDPLVAVVGLRLSTVQTEQAAKRLAQRGIPMVSSIATADQLNYGAIRGFVRASPPNTEYVAALNTYLRHRPKLDSALMVYDANSDASPSSGTRTGSDLFTRSLRADFDKGMEFAKEYPAQSFVGKSGLSKASPDLFTNITANLCAVKPEVVLYAGRVVDFGGFLDSLHNRVCPDTPMTVLAAGADFGALGLRSKQAQLAEKKLSVVYATETDPHGWVRGAPGTPQFFEEFYDQYLELGFAQADLDDGGAISTHDAMLIAAKAARLSARSHPDHTLPSHVDVLNQMLNLNSLDEVPGASGKLSFSYRGADSGNPSNKPVPVIEVPSSAEEQTAEVHLTR
jgi:ABC-type branched-subunit amino acid transport system substrate-binding protein